MKKKPDARAPKPTTSAADAARLSDADRVAQIEAHRRAEREARVEFTEWPATLDPSHPWWWAGRSRPPQAKGIEPSIYNTDTVRTPSGGHRLASVFDRERAWQNW